MDQRTDKIAQPPETEKMDGVKICEIKNSSGDSDLRKMENLFEILSFEIIERLQQFASCLDKAVEMHKKETDDWNKKREEQFKRQRDVYKDHEELWKQMQLWFEQNKNISPRSRAVDERFDSGAPVIPQQDQHLQTLRSEFETRYFVGPAADLSEDSEDEEAENVDADVEPDMEEEHGMDDEAEVDTEEQEEAEDPEATGFEFVLEYTDMEEESGVDDEAEVDTEEQEEVEDPEATGLEFVLEYTPVTSAIELPSLYDRTEVGKRKASVLLDDDNSKRRRLTLVECPVCQEALPEMARSGKVLMAATCGHVLCSNCAMRIWIQRRKRCPKCNTGFDINKLRPVYL